MAQYGKRKNGQDFYYDYAMVMPTGVLLICTPHDHYHVFEDPGELDLSTINQNGSDHFKHYPDGGHS